MELSGYDSSVRNKSASFWELIPYYVHKILLIFFSAILRSIAWVLFRFQLHLRHERKTPLPGPGKPFLLLGDHVSYLDPFVISTGLLRTIRWIAADGNFRNPLMRFLMVFLVGAVAKTKNHSDMESLKQMKLIAETGGVIGLFPEGEMSWDGVNGGLVQGTDKLVRFLKIPVVYCHAEGLYLSRPRWSRKARPRPVKCTFEQIIDEKEVGTLKLSEIRARILSAIEYDDYRLQKEAPKVLKTSAPAEGMERFLFTCPQCRNINTLKSKGNRLFCEECGFSVEVDSYGLMKEDKPFDSCHQWNLWQIDRLKTAIQQGEGKEEPFWEDQGMRLFKGKPKRKSRKVMEGSAAFYRDHIVLTNEQEEHIISMKELTGLNVFKAGYVEFLYRKMQYRLDFKSPHTSGVKWEILYRLLIENQKQHAEVC